MADLENTPPPAKRFRYSTYNQQLAKVKLDTGKSRGLSWVDDSSDPSSASFDEEALTTTTPLTTALSDLSLIHLCHPYVLFTKFITPLNRTLPLSLLNVKETWTAFEEFLRDVKRTDTTESSGLDGVLVLLEKWVETVQEEVMIEVEAREEEDKMGKKKKQEKKKTAEDEDEDDVDEELGEDLEVELDADVDVDMDTEQPTETLPSTMTANKTENLLTALSRSILHAASIPGLQPILVQKLYSTLSLILKVLSSHILSSSSAIIPELWVVFRPYLGDHQKVVVRNCVAEVWSGLVRRTRGKNQERMMDVVLGGVGEKQDDEEEKNEEGIALVLSLSMKGPGSPGSGLLHSRAVGLYSSLIRHCLVVPSHESTAKSTEMDTDEQEQEREQEQQDVAQKKRQTIAIYVTTAMIHHCSSEIARPIHELVAKHLEESLASASSSSVSPAAPSPVILRIASTLMSVRKGQRVPTGLLTRYLTALDGYSPLLRQQADNGRWRKEYIRAVVAGLMGGKLTDWLSPGVKLIDGVWNALVSCRPGFVPHCLVERDRCLCCFGNHQLLTRSLVVYTPLYLSLLLVTSPRPSHNHLRSLESSSDCNGKASSNSCCPTSPRHLLRRSPPITSPQLPSSLTLLRMDTSTEDS